MTTLKNQERAKRVKNRTEQRPDLIHKPTRSEKMDTIKKMLASAKKQLDDSIASQDVAKMKRSCEILQNVTEMLAREQSRA